MPALRTLLLAAILAAGVAGSAQARAPAVPRMQTLVALRAPQTARAAPRVTARALRRVAAERPITGSPTVLPVLGRSGGWLRVRLPGRPNGATGWIRARGTALTRTPWHLVVDIVRRRVIVFRLGRAVRAFSAVVGKPSTPTPIGTFFVEEAVRLLPGQAGEPFALALSARSNVLQEFDGGPGQIALHGIAHIGGVPGTAVSHGCVRLESPAMVWLVGRIGAGVPVTVTG
jgi:lipoprotein-anchoring transpeptidase ErfK/SrfK